LEIKVLGELAGSERKEVAAWESLSREEMKEQETYFSKVEDL
jgi:hypothetical protein